MERFVLNVTVNHCDILYQNLLKVLENGDIAKRRNLISFWDKMDKID
jgi:hypothetical protein